MVRNEIDGIYRGSGGLTHPVSSWFFIETSKNETNTMFETDTMVDTDTKTGIKTKGLGGLSQLVSVTIFIETRKVHDWRWDQDRYCNTKTETESEKTKGSVYRN